VDDKFDHLLSCAFRVIPSCKRRSLDAFVFPKPAHQATTPITQRFANDFLISEYPALEIMIFVYFTGKMSDPCVSKCKIEMIDEVVQKCINTAL